jgi:hypothetical protein
VSTTAAAPAPPTGAPARGWRRHRSTALVLLGLVAAVAVVVGLGGGPSHGGSLDPANPGPEGAQALARVLDDHGVDVTVVRSADGLDDVPLGPGTTVLVTSTDALGASTVARLVQHAEGATIVMVGAGPGVVHALGSRDLPNRVAVDARHADCADARFSGLTLEVDRALAYPGERGCFAGAEGSLLVERHGVTLFGADQALRNDTVLRGDNAAVVLRLLGADGRLVWYVPSFGDLVGDDGVSASSLLPRWLAPGLWLGAIAVGALMLWRGRRLGPLATEPLPVVVKAIETTRSRGRLYRRAGDRAHAAAALREAARARAAHHLRTGSTTPAALVRDVARHVARPESEVADLLGTEAPVPGTDRDLIALANDLAALDREVRRT